MYKLYIKPLIPALLITMLISFTGCENNDTLPEPDTSLSGDWAADYSPIPDKRTGVIRLGVSGLQNGFECTDAGVYFMCHFGEGDTYLLYGDHGSDTLIKLCGRPDCTHIGSDCNAYYQDGSNVCFYEGYLYTTEKTSEGWTLVRMNLDGTERINVIGTKSIGKSYSRMRSRFIWNGTYTVMLGSTDKDGAAVWQPYYYKLDGSMSALEETMMFPLPVTDIYDSFITIGSGNEKDYYDIYLSEPDTGKSTFLVHMPGRGFYGEKEAYYLQDGIIYHLTYATDEKEAVLDTGLQGAHELDCFPDCFVVTAGSTEDKDIAPENSQEQYLHFYNWDYKYLGNVKIDYARKRKANMLICGETAERIILTDNIFSIPRYYIEKSDFGTGNIELHEFNMPDVNWDELYK